jgi:hypothetical protein
MNTGRMIIIVVFLEIYQNDILKKLYQKNPKIFLEFS